MTAKILAVIAVILVGAGVAVGIVVGGMGPGMTGSYVSNFGTYMTITDDAWYENSAWGASYYSIVKHTSGSVGGTFIMQNSASASYNPSAYTKVEYHKIAGGWGYCMTVYDAASASAAESADTSAILDTNDAAEGCNGFPFTEVSEFAFPFAGSYSDNFGAALTVNETTWMSVSSWGTSLYDVEAYGDSYIIMQNDADATYNPSKWTKVEIGTTSTGFTYCMTLYDADSAEAALITVTSSFYDVANSTAGCNGFSHTVATKGS